ncbi:transposase [Flavobacterium croceum]|uniref:transposase n=1 Tax=Flavobacterium croceum TaxID=370975 RepID=UPI003742D557
MDSTPLEICEFEPIIYSTIDIRPSYGYCTATKKRYFKYKLHAVCDENSIIHSFNFTPANVHDIHYLKDIKHNLKNCTLIGNKEYLNTEYQIDLFNSSNINLNVPMRKNQINFQTYCMTCPKKSIQINKTKIDKLNSIKNVFDAVFSFIGFHFNFTLLVHLVWSKHLV